MTLNHYKDFLNHVRPLDMKEAELMTGEEPSLADFVDAEVLYDDETNEVYAVGGINFGYVKPVVWLLCTTRVEEHPVKFCRFTKDFLHNQWLRHISYLWNYVWLGNTLHVQWLKWMGAKFFEIKIVNGEQFQRFEFSHFHKKEGES